LDLSGELGRRFGSLGLAIDAFPTRLRVRPAPGISATGPNAQRAERSARRAQGMLGLRGGARVELDAATPGHLGLGSGTQMCLAVGTAYARLYGVGAATGDLAQSMGRGARSGIGVGSFDQGGFLMDGGRGANSLAPPVIARMAFPEQWRVLLLLDRRGEGLHGAGELDAFRRLSPFPAELAAHLCRLALMQIMPALAEQDLDPFARGIAELQRAVGDHFAPAQGGRFTSPAVADALAVAEGEGFPGVGQSSWGPTGFVLTESESQAIELAARLRRHVGQLSPVSFKIVQGCNHGSQVDTYPFTESLRKVF
ncbi:MAG: beta-ribofuranosylaminobenzene 5'-phosphate synthase family protein, partial [Thiohalocapsa sp.]